ncbi:MAG: phosphatidate cytidylyltransferase [Anaerolineales bacterium]|jgi:phosphatidate cytidylyltransferase
MLIKRTLAALALAVIGIPAMIVGGLFYYSLITLLLGVATWEYGRIFHTAGYNASTPLLVGGVVLLVGIRAYFPPLAPACLTLLILAAMTWHLFDYEKGRSLAAADFVVTVGGIVYLGWIGAYLIDIRNLPNGIWWLALVLPAAWLADIAAYFIGKRFGTHQLTSRLSPKKTWEGFWGGVIFGTVGTAGLAVLWHSLGGPAVTWWQGAALGATLSIFCTLGDLGESMFKRQAGMKDSSQIIPGHGGVLDRMDSWLWAGALGYLLIIWFLL